MVTKNGTKVAPWGGKDSNARSLLYVNRNTYVDVLIMYVVTLGVGQKQSLKSMPVAGTFIPSAVLSRGLKMTVLIKDGGKKRTLLAGKHGPEFQ